MLLETPLFGITLTVIAFVMGLYLHQRIRWLHPLITTTGGIILFLSIADIPYEQYQLGGDIISFFLGPATVALAIPFYKYYPMIKEKLGSIVLGVVLGSLTGLLIVGLLGLFLESSREVLLTMIPKTVTTPIAIEIIESLGGVPELGAVLTVLTGLIGSMVGPKILSLCKITSDVAIGVAIGTSSHGIGTARLLLESEVQGSVSGFAMGLAGILLSIMLLPVYYMM